MQLACIALAVRDPEDLADRLERDFGLPRDVAADADGFSVPLLRAGACGLALFQIGKGPARDVDRPGIHHLVMRADDIDAAVTAAAAAGIGARAAIEWCGAIAVPLEPTQLGGVRLYICDSLHLPAAAPGPIERVDHIGVASANNASILDTFCVGLGFELESRQTDLEVATAVESFSSDKYGVVRHSRSPEPVGGLRVAFVTVGDCELELLQNFDPAQQSTVDHGARGTTRQDQGAISRYIASRGAGLHHLAFKVGDIDALLGNLADAGYELIDPVGRPGSRRARIGFIHPRSLGGVLVHLVERRELTAGS